MDNYIFGTIIVIITLALILYIIRTDDEKEE